MRILSSAATAAVLTLAPPAPITTPFSYAGAVFRKTHQLPWRTNENGESIFLEPGYLKAGMSWDSPDTRALSIGGQRYDTRTRNGRLEIPGSVGEYIFALPIALRAPFIGVQLEVFSLPTTGDSYATVGLLSSVNGNISGDRVYGIYDHINKVCRLHQFINGVHTDLSTDTPFTPSGPFTLCLQLADRSLVLSVIEAGKTERTLCRTMLSTTGRPDFRLPATLSLYNQAYFSTILNNSGGQTATVGTFQSGGLRGKGPANQSTATFGDGTPIQRSDGAVLKMISMAHTPGVSDGSPATEFGAVTCNNVQLMWYNLFTGKVEVRAKLYCKHTDGRIYGHNSGSITYFEHLKKWALIIPTWGLQGGGYNDVQMYLYLLDELPSGETVLENGILLNVPTNTAAYDPDLKYIDGLISLTYSATNTKTNWTEFWPVRCTNTALTGDGWGFVAQYRDGANHEGTKQVKENGQWRVLASNFTTMLSLNLDMEKVGEFPGPSTDNSMSAHPDMVELHDGVNARIFWIAFDTTRWDDAHYTWSSVTTILEAIVRQVGHNYSFKRLLALG